MAFLFRVLSTLLFREIKCNVCAYWIHHPLLAFGISTFPLSLALFSTCNCVQPFAVNIFCDL
uniref:Uncharacterized protein n=1 Tax=Anguilla anguilla TaxID=7936 RepID=A0A0E9U9F8_ANGAN